jgi:hypothetical protein
MRNEGTEEVTAHRFSTGIFLLYEYNGGWETDRKHALLRGTACKWKSSLVETGGDVKSRFEVGHTCRKLLSKLEPWVNNLDYTETTQHWTVTVRKSTRQDIDVAVVEWFVRGDGSGNGKVRSQCYDSYENNCYDK